VILPARNFTHYESKKCFGPAGGFRVGTGGNTFSAAATGSKPNRAKSAAFWEPAGRCHSSWMVARKP